MIETRDHLAPRAANHAPLTPLDALDRTVATRPDAPAAIWGERRLSWSGLDALVQRMAARLRAIGVGRGDVVSVILPNRPEMLAAHFAVPLLGAVLNGINTRLDAEAVRYILDHAEARLVIADPARVGLALEAAGDRPVLCLGAEAPEGAETWNPLDEDDTPEPRIDWREHVIDEWQPIALNYTSGTTGNPKGVVLHHRGAALNAAGQAYALGFDASTVYLWTLPLFHCNGWCHGWAVTLAGGAHVCLDGVDPSEVFDALANHGVTHFYCAPVVLYMLLDHPAREGRAPDAPRVEVGTGGAAPTTRLIEQTDALGFEITHLYGLTECYGPVTVNRLSPEERAREPGWKAERLASQGRRHETAAPLAVLGEDDRPVPADGAALGEIVLAGNTLMAGYLKDPEATAAAFRGGWFRTGDLAVMDPDGMIRVRDRAKDVIISGGENVSSLEVENVLHRHPGVRLAAVVARPDEKWGETPCAFVEPKEGAEIDPAEIEAFCRERLAGFKRPRRVVLAEIPKTATGKVQKFLLRRMAAELDP